MPPLEYIAGEDIFSGDRVGLSVEDGKAYRLRKPFSHAGFVTRDIKAGERFTPDTILNTPYERYIVPDGVILEIDTIHSSVVMLFYEERFLRVGVNIDTEFARVISKGLAEYADQADTAKGGAQNG